MSYDARDRNLLEIEGVDIAQGDRTLLAGFSCTLQAGELVAVTGPSGCGKTTLLRTAAGLIGDGSGVYLRGEAPCDMCWPDYRRQVLLVAQQPVLLAGSVADNLARPFGYGHVDGEFDTERVRRLLDRLLLKEVALEARARELSVGQQQRVCLVRSLLLRPRVLLLDEPTSALDAEAAGRVADLLVELADADGLAALIVTHDRNAAERWCHRFIDLSAFVPEVVT